MRLISRWARRHRYLAIALLIGCEVANAVNGLLLGANVLADCPRELLLMSMLILLGFGCWARWQGTATVPKTYAGSRRQLAGAFGSTYLLFVLLGGEWGQSVIHPSGSRAAFGSQQVVMRSDTLIKPEKPTDRVANTVAIPTATPKDDNQGGRRFGFVLLFLLGLGLLFVSVVLACSIACSGQGFLAAIVLFLGMGAGAGGIFFLSRGTEKPTRRWRDIPLAERPRITRRFWLAWLFLTLIIGGLILIA